MSGSYRLVVKSGGVIGTAYALESAEIFLGRDAQNDIVIAEADISRRHARLRRADGGYVIEDLGSTNGTFVNGQRLTAPHRLRSGEEIRLGPHVVLVYESVGDPGATVAIAAETVQTAAPAPPPPSPPPPSTSAPPPPRARSAPPPPPTPSAVPRPRSANRWWLFLLILVILGICFIGAALWYIDANKLWCAIFPFLFPGACP